ncbi:hypothetical protein ACNI5A_33895, partial [Klebsiella pneumoniae]|uniref:hypothetical protein n=1 Tax=Klebsiella pneumoniae TaxID=573 RepID=UPI003A88655E
AVGVWVVNRDEATEPPPPAAEGGITVIMTNEERGMWPGGITRLPDGSFYVVYERIDPTAQAFGMVVPDLL